MHFCIFLLNGGAVDAGSCPGLGRSHMPQSGWAREPWPLSLLVRSLCSAMGEVTTVRGPHTAKKTGTQPHPLAERLPKIMTRSQTP